MLFNEETLQESVVTFVPEDSMVGAAGITGAITPSLKDIVTK